MLNLTYQGLLAIYIPNGAVIACIVLGVLIAVVTAVLLYLLIERKKRIDAVAEKEIKEEVSIVIPSLADKPRQPVAHIDYSAPKPVKKNVTADIAELISSLGIKNTASEATGATVLDGDALVKNEYDRSFKARLIQLDDAAKEWYSQLKNETLAYKGVKSRASWHSETFSYRRKKLVKFVIRGKTLCLYFALDFNEIKNSKYVVEDASEKQRFAEIPTLYRIKNNKRCRYAKELIESVMSKNELIKGDGDVIIDYASEYPYCDDKALLEERLIKPLVYKEKKSAAVGATMTKVSVGQVSRLLGDEVAHSLIIEGQKFCDKTKGSIVNIDTLSAHFGAGERVTLDEMKKRVPAIGKKVTYIKVLARGVLDKPLIVEADDFSIDAVKMIVLTGGKAIKTKVK